MEAEIERIKKWLNIIGVACDDSTTKLIFDQSNFRKISHLCDKFTRKLEYYNLIQDSITYHYLNDAYEAGALKMLFHLLNIIPENMSFRGKQAHKELINVVSYLPRVSSYSLNLIELSLEILIHKYFDYQIKMHENDVAEKELQMQLKEIEELPEVIDKTLKNKLLLPRFDVYEESKSKDAKSSTSLDVIHSTLIKECEPMKNITTHEAIDNFHLRLKELMDKIEIVELELEIYKKLPKNVAEAKKVLESELNIKPNIII